MTIQERYTQQSVERISVLPSGILTEMVYTVEDPIALRAIGKALFLREASVLNDNPEAPFILWPAINKDPHQPWLPILVAKVAKADFHKQLQDTHLVVIGPPASATWYMEYVQEHHIFPVALFPRVLKEKQAAEMKIDLTGSLPLEVPSYVHNRQEDGTRGTQTMYVLDREMFRPNGKKRTTVLLLDDAIAEGITTEVLARHMKKEFSVNTVLIASPMAKLKQEGKQRLQNSRYVDGVCTIVDVTKTHGKGMPIEIA